MNGVTLRCVYRGHVLHWRWVQPDFLAAVAECATRGCAWSQTTYARRRRRVEAKGAAS